MNVAELKIAVNANLQRPPVKRLGLIAPASIIPLLVFAYFFRSSGDIENGRLGPFARVAMPLFFGSLVVAQLLSAIGDLQRPEHVERIVLYRRLSWIPRAMAFLAIWSSKFGIMFVD